MVEFGFSLGGGRNHEKESIGATHGNFDRLIFSAAAFFGIMNQMDDCHAQFVSILYDIRRGPDQFRRIREFRALRRRVQRLQDSCPGGLLLLHLLDYYFSQRRAARPSVLRLCKQLVERPGTPPWLRLEGYSILAGLTLVDPAVSRRVNDGYRSKALRLANRYGFQEDAVIILNNWLFASLTRHDTRAASRLVRQLDRRFASLRRPLQRAPRLREAFSRFSTHRAKLLLISASASADSRRHGLTAAISALYKQSLRIEGADTNRRVNILVEWSESLLKTQLPAAISQAKRSLDVAAGSLDTNVTDLSRAYFYDVRGQVRRAEAERLSHENPLAAAAVLERAREDLDESLDLYKGSSKPFALDVRERLQEVKMLLEHLTSPPPEISMSLSAFRRKYPDPSRTVFIMMDYVETRTHHTILRAVKGSLADHGYVALRADDRHFHSDLYYNVLTYLYGCGLGVAIFERIENNLSNPNVALEVGYLFGLRKPVCLLKERTVEELPSDLRGRLYTRFNLQDLRMSVRHAISSWLRKTGGLPKRRATRYPPSFRSVAPG